MNLKLLAGIASTLPNGDIYKVRWSPLRWAIGRHPLITSITDEHGNPTPIRPNTPEFRRREDGSYPRLHDHQRKGSR